MNDLWKMISRDVNEIKIHSGNILFSSLHSSEEICFALCNVTKKWMATSDVSSKKQAIQNVYISSDKSEQDTIEDVDCADMKITLKIFLVKESVAEMYDAIQSASKELPCGKLDAIILSFLPTPSEIEKEDNFMSVKFGDIKDLWCELENMVENGRVSELGVSDFDATSLQDLYQTAKVKPSINQVNLGNCCYPPTDLSSFAFDHQINLFTHNDPQHIFPDHCITKLFDGLDPRSTSDDADLPSWKVSYVVKYTIVDRPRAIVKNKGYFLKLLRA